MSDNDRTVFVNFEKEMPRLYAEDKLPVQERSSAMVLTENVGEVSEEIEKDLEVLYMKLGKAYYEGGFEDPLPELLPLFDKITRIKTEMEEHRKKVIERKENICLNCGMKLDHDAKFCGHCGHPVE